MDIVMAVLALVIALSCLVTLLISEVRDYRKRAAANKAEGERAYAENTQGS